MGDRQDDRLRPRSITLLLKQKPINRSFNTMNLLAGDVMYQNLLQQDQKTGIQLHWHEQELKKKNIIKMDMK